MLVFAHRGCHLECPENTMESFQQAAATGVDGIETDVRLTRDRQLILFHDRWAKDGTFVADRTRAELEALEGGSLPTAADALAAFPQLIWNLEIKVRTAVGPLCQLLASIGAAPRVVLSSFDHAAISDAAVQHRGDCGLLVAHRPDSQPFPQRPASGNVNSIMWYYEFADAAVMDAARSMGWKNYLWGIATPAEHQLVSALPIHGLITDHPEWVPSTCRPNRAAG
jgi:glycerophosphoryl diester phosphodiesterase